MSNKTTKFLSREAALASRKWVIVDASGIPVGRLATHVASLLRGKHRPDFTPHVDCGDFVVVINASKAVFTGKKAQQKRYYWHTGYVGGIKSISAEDRLEQNPERVITSAVKGMLPRGALFHQIIKKLKVYEGDTHPHSAQNPQPYNIEVRAA